MTRKVNIHGIISMLLILDATIIGLFSIAQQSLAMAVIYLLLFLTALLVIAKFYCAKCLCREHCNHLIVGWISQKISKKHFGRYTIKDMVFGAILPFIPVVLIPQFYLYQSIVYLLLYWLLFGIAILEINTYVCRGCKNRKCKLATHKK